MPTADNYNQQAMAAQVKIAVLEEKVTNLTFAMQRMTEAQKATDIKLDQVLTALAEARGGWKLMMAAGGGAAAITGLITWALTHFKS